MKPHKKKITVLAAYMGSGLKWITSLDISDTNRIYGIMKKNVDTFTEHFDKTKFSISPGLFLIEMRTEQLRQLR